MSCPVRPISILLHADAYEDDDDDEADVYDASYLQCIGDDDGVNIAREFPSTLMRRTKF